MPGTGSCTSFDVSFTIRRGRAAIISKVQKSQLQCDETDIYCDVNNPNNSEGDD